MPWAVAAAGITAAAGLGSAAMQSSAAKSGQSAAIGAQQQALEQARSDLQPWVGTGGDANTASANLLGLNGPDAAASAMKNYQTSPGYQWQMDQGLRAVDQGKAALGMLRSGATLKAEQTFGQGLANSDFGQYYNRLFSLSTLGENAAAGQGTGEITTGQGIAGTDRLAGSQQSGIYGNVGKGLGDTVGGLLSNPDVQSTLKSGWNSLMGGGSTGAGGFNVNTTALNPAEQNYANTIAAGGTYKF